MNRYSVSDEAVADLSDIWLHVAADNPTAADSLIDRLVAGFEKLARRPGLGRPRPEFKGGRLRSLAVGRYVIFYLPGDGEVGIVRVLHGARDLPGIL